jgi:hypothetical protein
MGNLDLPATKINLISTIRFALVGEVLKPKVDRPGSMVKPFNSLNY